MSNKIKVGVVGVGALGRHHARLYQQCDNAELVGVYDKDPDRAQAVGEELGAAVFDDQIQLAEAVQALSIAVPSHLHYQVADTFLDMNKHLLIEKPITIDVEHAKHLLAKAKANSRILHVGHVERFNPVISYLEKKVDDPRFIECHRLASYPPPRPGAPPRGTEVGVVLDLMIHDIDMVLNLIKSEVAAVEAIGIPVLSPTEDIANARLRFENGAVANLTASRVSPEPMRKIRVFQNNCYVSLDYGARKGEIYVKDGAGINREQVPIEDHNALLKELEHFLDSIQVQNQTGQVPASRISGESGTKALELAVEIRRRMSL